MPPAVACDNAKEMVLRDFDKKLKEASCHLRQMAQFAPWLNAAKRKINEAKKDSSRKLMMPQRDFGIPALSLSPK